MTRKNLDRVTLPALLAALGGAGVLLSTAAQAEDQWYFGLTGLAGTADVSSAMTDLVPGVPGGASIDTDTGFGWGGSFGRELGDRWRVEGEVVYRSNDLNDFRAPGETRFEQGDYASLVFAANGYYSFGDTGARWRPYVGAGIGLIQEIDIDLEDAAGENSFSGDGVAVQVMAGLSYQPSPNWVLDLEARYLTASDIDMDAEEGVFDGRITADYDVFTLGAVLRYRF